MSFSDTFANESQINTTNSQNFIYDPRQLVCQTRNSGATYLNAAFANLNGWTVSQRGSATITIVTPGQQGTGNPTGSTGVQFSTGATLNSLCAISRVLPTLPSSYSVFMLPALVAIDSNPQDALTFTLQNTANNKVLTLQAYAGGFSVIDASGASHLLSSHSPAYACENWIENKDNGDGTNTITLYQGTQFVASVVATLPVGAPANAGNVEISQLSGATANQVSQLFGFNIGVTQLPDNAVIQGVAYPLAFNAPTINLTFLVEDVCNNVILNTDFTAQVAIGTGGISTGNWQQLTLTDRGSWSMGIIDYTKPVRIFTASFTVSGGLGTIISLGEPIAYKAHMLNGKFMALLGVTIVPTSIY